MLGPVSLAGATNAIAVLTLIINRDNDRNTGRQVLQLSSRAGCQPSQPDRCKLKRSSAEVPA